MHIIRLTLTFVDLYIYGNYRSRVLVEFGTPIVISQELVEIYKKSRREACTLLLESVKSGLRNVTLNVPNFKTCMFFVKIKNNGNSANYCNSQKVVPTCEY
jgi:hypothetical protein